MSKLLPNKNIVKRILLIGVVSIFGGFLYYSSLTNLQKSTAKMKLLHGLNLIDNSWEINAYPNKIVLTSPTLLIDGIYKSMQGPHDSNTFRKNNS